MEPVYTVAVDPDSRTIRPISPDGDTYFGLGPGTNGTAAICRRALVQPEGFTWVRASGRAAVGITMVPTCHSELITVGCL